MLCRRDLWNQSLESLEFSYKIPERDVCSFSKGDTSCPVWSFGRSLKLCLNCEEFQEQKLGVEY
jgi:hypothetical protein